LIQAVELPIIRSFLKTCCVARRYHTKPYFFLIIWLHDKLFETCLFLSLSISFENALR
jgi:hypothetical protein